MSGARLRQALKRLALDAIRWVPLPWRLKWLALWLASPKMLVAGMAVIPDATGRVLMLRSRYADLWQFPGGTINAGEDVLSGTLRECREEIGVAVQVERLTGIYTMRGAADLFIAFRCAPLAAPPRLSVEHTAWRYLDPAAAPRTARAIIADALREPAALRIAALTTDHEQRRLRAKRGAVGK